MIIAGFICAAYGAGVLSVIGTGALFNYFFLATGICLILFGVFLRKREKGDRSAQFLKRAFLVALAVFLAVEATITGYSFAGCDSGADYVIVLGTQIRDSGPSVDYRARLDAAAEYMKENPGSTLIATGGKGANEPVSEAEGGIAYLSGRGIEEDRMIAEDMSRNTVQNLVNAVGIIKDLGDDPGETKIVIISARYHLLRARYIAAALGCEDVTCKGSTGLLFLQPHFYAREFFALVKDLIMFRGN